MSAQAMAPLSWRWPWWHHCPFSWAHPPPASHIEFSTLRPKLREHPGADPASSLRCQPVHVSLLSLREAVLTQAGGGTQGQSLVLDAAIQDTIWTRLRYQLAMCYEGLPPGMRSHFSLAGVPQVPAWSSEVGEVTPVSEAGRVWY